MRYDELWDLESGLYPLFGESVSGDKHHNTWVEWWQIYSEEHNMVVVAAWGGEGSTVKKVVVL